MAKRKNIVIGLLGTMLDDGRGGARWQKWRPTVSICQQEDLLIGRFELLYTPKFEKLAKLISEDIRSVSPETEVNAVPLDFKDPWDFEEVYGALHDFARNYSFDPDRNDYLVHITTGSHVAQICLYLLTESRLIPGKLLQTSPPDRAKQSTPGQYSIIDLDLSKYDKIASRFRREAKDDISFLKSGIETRNVKFNKLMEMIERVAIRSKAPLLLMGPTGAGKSQLAKKIYELKKARRQVQGNLIEVNCATLRGDMAMSSLFGHIRGAFTGAIEDRPGLLMTANKGLLFLDEIGELGLDEQAMLLRALEEKTFLPVGAVKESTSDFQLICGTNRDLAREVERGKFREDLLARINLWSFYLPGLKERPEDIEPNIEYELDLYARTHGEHITFNREARDLFIKFSSSPEAAWQANFRDLNGAITRMATLAEGGRINEAVVKAEMERLRKVWGKAAPLHANQRILNDFLTHDELSGIDAFDQAQLAFVLSMCKELSSLSEAGRKLFNISREKKAMPNDADRLSKYLAKYGIDWQKILAGRKTEP
jgi:transcriptional regulatory protein RtcR